MGGWQASLTRELCSCLISVYKGLHVIKLIDNGDQALGGFEICPAAFPNWVGGICLEREREESDWGHSYSGPAPSQWTAPQRDPEVFPAPVQLVFGLKATIPGVCILNAGTSL